MYKVALVGASRTREGPRQLVRSDLRRSLNNRTSCESVNESCLEWTGRRIGLYWYGPFYSHLYTPIYIYITFKGVTIVTHIGLHTFYEL